MGIMTVLAAFVQPRPNSFLPCPSRRPWLQPQSPGPRGGGIRPLRCVICVARLPEAGHLRINLGDARRIFFDGGRILRLGFLLKSLGDLADFLHELLKLLFVDGVSRANGGGEEMSSDEGAEDFRFHACAVFSGAAFH